jgi:amino acid transporter
VHFDVFERGESPPVARRPYKTLLSQLWAVLAGLLLLWTLLEVASAISEAGSDATYASRSPGALMVIALMGVAAGLGSLHSAWGAARDRPRKLDTRGGVWLTGLTAMLILLYALRSLHHRPAVT